MFQLPQASTVGDEQEMRNGRPVIKMDDESQILRNLIKCCYPVYFSHPFNVDTPDEIALLWNAAIKYDMEAVERFMRSLLVQPQLLENYAFCIYSIAIQHRCEQEIRIAAKSILRGRSPLDNPYSKEIERITGGDLYRLHRCFKECSQAAILVVQRRAWPKLESDIGFAGLNCVGCRQTDKITETLAGHTYYTNKWLVEYLSNAGKALARSPCGATVLAPSLIEGTIHVQLQCRNCLNRGASTLAEELHKVAEYLAISQVRLIIIYQIRSLLLKGSIFRSYWMCSFEQGHWLALGGEEREESCLSWNCCEDGC